jgi:hypothetical protein
VAGKTHLSRGAHYRCYAGACETAADSGHAAGRFANDGGAQLVGFSQTAESWLAFLAESVVGSGNELSAEAVADFEDVRQNIGEALRTSRCQVSGAGPVVAGSMPGSGI